VTEPLPMLDRSLLSDRALTVLVGAIRRGEFPDGRIPAEPELARQFGVSRATVRSALASLEQLGLVRRRPGLGTRLRPQVTADILALHGLVPWAVLLSGSYQVTGTSTLRAASPAEAKRLAAITGEVPRRAHRIERMLAADGCPAVLMEEIIPGDVLSKPLDPDDLADSVMSLSRQHFRVPIDHAIAHLVPANANERLVQLFGIAAGGAYLVLEEAFYSDSDEPLATAVVSLNPAFISLGVFRRILR
jgi:DNA-binding GntR family transcriptional regulator